nr:ribonuclease H-like domain-containing protein [Tanacetum cinerariifolium]
MVKTSSSSKNEACCSKSCKKNTDSLNSKITKLNDKLGDRENMLVLEFKVESRADCIESLTKELELIKKEKKGLDSKLEGFQTASKDLDNLLESQRSDKNKEGLGYIAVPPPPAQVYSPPKKDMSWTGLLKFADDTISDYTRPSPSVESNPNDLQNSSSSTSENGESTGSILSKPEIKFVKPADSPTVVKTEKKEIVRKPSIKYAELYRKTTKRSNVRANQRNWNNLKSQQLGKNFVMKKACYNCGGVDHLSYDCDPWVKKGKSSPRNNFTHKSMPPRPAIHRVDRFPTVDLKFSTTARRVKTAAPRPNMNSTRLKTTQDLVVILTHRVLRLDRELKARTPIQKVDRGRSKSVMAWVSKKGFAGNKMLKAFPLPVMSSHCQKFGDSYEAPQDDAAIGTTSEGSAKKKGMTIAVTTENMQKRRNDVKERTTLLLALPDEHQLRFNKYKTAQELLAAILKIFGGNEATKKTKNRLKQQYGNFKAEAKNSNGNGEVNTASIPTANTQVSPASANVAASCQFWKKTGKKISIQCTDVAVFDKSKVECFNCHKMGHFARECRAPRSQDRGRRENYRQGLKEEEEAPKALMAIDGVGWD